MFNNIEEVKSFIEWAKTQKIKSLKVGDVEVEISEISYVEELGEQTENPLQRKDILAASKETTEDEELLFWSAGR
jgi:hypothetical protein